jgi:hypothetical protein
LRSFQIFQAEYIKMAHTTTNAKLI